MCKDITKVVAQHTKRGENTAVKKYKNNLLKKFQIKNNTFLYNVKQYLRVNLICDVLA